MSAIGGAGGAGRPSWPEPGEDGPRRAEAAAPRAAREAAVRPIGRRGARRPVAEASGIAYHPGRRTLFVVGDRGHLAEVALDGSVLRRTRVKHLDLEGITIGPEGRLYAVVEEKPPRILEIDPDDLEVRRTIEVERRVRGKRVIARRPNEGLEGLCWVAEEGAFFALNQDHPPRIVRLDLPEGKKGKARIREIIDLGDAIDRGSDLAWDAAAKRFLVIEAGRRGAPGAIHEVTREGRLARTKHIAGEGQEGIAIGPGGALFIALDGGGLVRVDR